FLGSGFFGSGCLSVSPGCGGVTLPSLWWSLGSLLASCGAAGRRRLTCGTDKATAIAAVARNRTARPMAAPFHQLPPVVAVRRAGRLLAGTSWLIPSNGDGVGTIVA